MALEKSLKGKSKPKKSGSKKKSKSKAPRHMHIEKADNGGFNVRHSYDQDSPEEPPTPDTTHPQGDENSLLQHVQNTFGGQLGGTPDMSGAAGGGGGGAAPGGM